MGIGEFVNTIKEKLGLKTEKANEELKLPSLEYVLIFQESGLPIYTRCMGQVCKMLAVDETLLSGFLSAISTLPSMFGQENSGLMAIELGQFKLMFHPTTRRRHIVCIGIPLKQYSPEVERHIKEALTKIEYILEVDFQDEDWAFITDEKVTKLEHELAEQVLVRYFEVAEPPHKHEEKCPLDPIMLVKTQEEFKNQPFWTRISNLYKTMKSREK